MFLSLSTILAIVSALLAAILITRVILRVDGKVDDRQEAYSKLAGLLERACLPKMASIGHSLAALSIRRAARKIRALVDSLDGKEELLLAFKANFEWQLKNRIEIADERKALIKAIIASPEARAEFHAQLPTTVDEFVGTDPIS